MRLIDADALLQEVDELKKSPWFNKNYDWARFVCNETMEIIESLCIDTAPVVDAMPVVRCGDCKHRDPEDKKCDCGHDIMWQLPRADEWFCADGEAKQ